MYFFVEHKRIMAWTIFGLDVYRGICRLYMGEEAAKGAQMEKITIFDWVYSTDASWDADLGKTIIFLYLLVFHVYFITG